VKVLFLGDSPLGGASTYLYCILRHLKLQVLHVPPGENLKRNTFLKFDPNILIISDYHYKKLIECEPLIIERTQAQGMGLLMVGGWSSFYGGGFQGSRIEKILPVKILSRDDRLNYSPGLRVLPVRAHAVNEGLNFKLGPIICGLNKCSPKPDAVQIMKAIPLKFHSSANVSADSKKSYPLLVLGEAGAGKSACFTSDFAPHWAGGILDWGSKRIMIKIPEKKLQIEIGNCYIGLIKNLMNWLGEKK